MIRKNIQRKVHLQIKMSNGSHAMWTPSITDILAEDWEVIK